MAVNDRFPYNIGAVDRTGIYPLRNDKKRRK